MGGIFAGHDFWLDLLMLLKLEFIGPCKVFCVIYSGDASSALQSFIMLMLYLNFPASETKLFGLPLTVMHLFLKSWLPAAVDGICVTSDFFC